MIKKRNIYLVSIQYKIFKNNNFFTKLFKKKFGEKFYMEFILKILYGIYFKNSIWNLLPFFKFTKKQTDINQIYSTTGKQKNQLNVYNYKDLSFILEKLQN